MAREEHNVQRALADEPPREWQEGPDPSSTELSYTSAEPDFYTPGRYGQLLESDSKRSDSNRPPTATACGDQVQPPPVAYRREVSLTTR